MEDLARRCSAVSATASRSQGVKVAFTERAEADLEAVGDWIGKDNPHGAISFVQEMRRACLDIGPRPILLNDDDLD